MDESLRTAEWILQLNQSVNASLQACKNKKALEHVVFPRLFRLEFGGAEEDRTPDLRIANATLSQLSYRPKSSRRLYTKTLFLCAGAHQGLSFNVVTTGV